MRQVNLRIITSILNKNIRVSGRSFNKPHVDIQTHIADGIVMSNKKL